MTNAAHSHNEAADAVILFEAHCKTGEPLDEEEVETIVVAGLAAWDEFVMRGGGLWWHQPTFTDALEDDE